MKIGEIIREKRKELSLTQEQLADLPGVSAPAVLKLEKDPDYREEVLVRDFATGKVLERMAGDLRTMPDGQKWLLV